MEFLIEEARAAKLMAQKVLEAESYAFDICYYRVQLAREAWNKASEKLFELECQERVPLNYEDVNFDDLFSDTETTSTPIPVSTLHVKPITVELKHPKRTRSKTYEGEAPQKKTRKVYIYNAVTDGAIPHALLMDFLKENKAKIVEFFLDQGWRRKPLCCEEYSHAQPEKTWQIPPEIREQYNISEGVHGMTRNSSCQKFGVRFRSHFFTGLSLGIPPVYTYFRDPRDASDIVNKIKALYVVYMEERKKVSTYVYL
jgi:hypothetical protein